MTWPVRTTLWTLAMAGSAAAAQAAHAGGVLFVDDSGPAGDGASWKGALSSLQAALEVAGDPQNGVCEIRVAQGVYKPTARIDPADPRSVTFSMLDAVAMRGGYAGVGAPDPNARDIELYPTILSGDLAGNDGAAGTFLNYEENAYHVVLSLGTSATALLDGVTITAGSGCCGLDQYDPRGFGGGVFHDGAAQFIDCTFTLNQAATRGGGFYNAGGAPVFVRCSFTRNRATDAYADGGGLYCQHGQVLLAFCTFDWNEAQAGGGFFATSSTINLFECVFEHNRALMDDGYAGAGWLGGCEFFATGCTFQQNDAGWATGGLLSIKGTADLTDCWFINNTADEAAGALSSDNLRLDGCHFVDNFSKNGGAISASGMVEIRHCEFIDNGALYWGGALFVSNMNGQTVITDSTFGSNAAGFNGGAIAYGGPAPLLIERCQFLGNASDDGGALFCAFVAPDIRDCVFTNNSAQSGGAIQSNLFANLSLVNCEFRSNQAVYGGGAMCLGGNSELSALNCLFAANRSFKTRGGAIEIGSPMDLVNCTFVNNQAPLAGAVYTQALPWTASNCIFWGNLPDQIVDYDGLGTVQYSDVQGGWFGQGVGNINAPPAFVNLSLGDYRLAAGSPCIDAGSSALWPPGFMLDLANLSRIIDDPRTPDTGQGKTSIIDMGAYEFQTVIPACMADCALPHDGMVNVNDLLAVISAWGATDAHPADLNGDGVVNANDLLLVIAAWGPCPA